MRSGSRVLLALLGVVILSASAAAAPRMWTLSGVTFSDGGTASGSLIYDADTNTYSGISITSTAGTVILTGATFNFFSNGFAPGAGGVLVNVSNAPNLTGTRGFAIFFNPPLTDVLTSTSVINSQEATCVDATCSAPTPPARFVIAGTAAGAAVTAVPTLSPPMFALLALALVGAGLFLMRR
jgi:hypothetical protein